MKTKEIIITDPCYILPNEEWDKALNASDFPTKLTQVMHDFGYKDAVVDETGFGDWTNLMHSASPDAVVKQKEFCADSGMVCVTTLTPLVKKHLDVAPYCYAVCEVPLDAEYTIDKSNPNWSVVLIHSPEKILYAKSAEDEDGEF